MTSTSFIFPPSVLPPARFKYQPAVLPGTKVIADCVIDLPADQNEAWLFRNRQHIPRRISISEVCLPNFAISSVDSDDEASDRRLAAQSFHYRLLLLNEDL